MHWTRTDSLYSMLNLDEDSTLVRSYSLFAILTFVVIDKLLNSQMKNKFDLELSNNHWYYTSHSNWNSQFEHHRYPRIDYSRFSYVLNALSTILHFMFNRKKMNLCLTLSLSIGQFWLSIRIVFVLDWLGVTVSIR